MTEPHAYQLKTVRQGASVILLVTIVMAFLFGLILMALFVKGTINILLITLPAIGLFIFSISKLFDKLLIKRTRNLKLNEAYFEYQGSKYEWEEIDWYKEEDSAIIHSFVIGTKDGTKLRLNVTKKKSEELAIWTNMKEEFFRMMDVKQVKVRNFYDSIFWRRMARIVLASNLLFVGIFLFLDIQWLKLLPGTLVWLGTSLGFVMTVFSNQEVKKRR